MKRFFLLLFLLLSVAFSKEIIAAKFNLDGPPTSFSDPGYSVEDLKADLYSDGTILLVTGKIRNLKHIPIKGIAVVHLQDSNNDEIGIVEVDVNKKYTFHPGELGNFEATINVENVSGLNNVSIQFIGAL